MNSLIKNLAFCAVLGASGGAQAITVGVDSGKTWNGYMNVSNLPSAGGAYQFGGGWGTADLNAVFTSTGLKLSPNTIGDPNPYWYTPSGGPGAAGNKIMAASMYVEVNDNSLSGTSVTFAGEVLSNTFTSAHSTVVFIKDFAPDYSSFNVSSAPLTTGAFSITLGTSAGPGRHVQYGFETTGVNVWFTDTAPFGAITIKDNPVTNFDFEIPNGVAWGTTQGTVTYPTNNGNPNGNAVLQSTGGFAVLYAFNNAEKSFASLGLSPGNAYTIQVDMKVISGGIGGIRLEGPAGYVVDQFAAANTGGSDWATYSFPLTVPNSAAQSKFGLRTPDGSTVAFDNFKIILPGPPAAPKSSIATGNIVGWTAASTVNTYQPQESSDNSTWLDIGLPLTGNTVASRFALGTSPYYQVVETTPPAVGNGVPNPGFETAATASPTNPGAQDWSIVVAPNPNAIMTVVSSYPGGYTPHSGSKMLVIDGTTPATGPVTPPDTNVRSSFVMPVTGGLPYTLSFYAQNPVQVGGANPQFYIQYWSDFGFISDTFTSFASAGSTWTQIQKNFTPPVDTTKVQIGFIQAMGAGNGWQWITLIDDLSLVVPVGTGTSTVLSATAVPAVQVTWDTLNGSSYQVKSSPDLSTWTNFSTPVNGNGSPFSVVDPISASKKFYRVLQTTP